MDVVRFAVEKGYRILEIYEVFAYQVTQYNPETAEGGLFVDYINTFLFLKAEGSGYPGGVHSPEDDERYVESFWQIEGIRLETEAIRYNAAKRGLAKLSQLHVAEIDGAVQSEMTKIITEPKELYGFLATPGVEVMNLVFASYDVVWISWKYRAEEDVPRLRHTNEVIGAYVTAGRHTSLSLFRPAAREQDVL